MRRSIRYQLLFYMLIAVLFFAILLIFSNTYLVEAYYLAQMKKELQRSGSEIEAMIENAPYHKETAVLELQEETIEELARLERKKGQSLVLSNEQGSVFYPFQVSGVVSSTIVINNQPELAAEQDHTLIVRVENEAKERLSDPLEEVMVAEIIGETEAMGQFKTFYIQSNPAYLSPVSEQVISTEGDQISFLLTNDINIKAQTISYQKVLENGLLLYVSAPMSIISDGITIVNQFSTVIVLITIIFTVLWSYSLSHHFIKPIQQMRRITSKMADLCFDEKIQLDRKDELYQLSEDINYLSNQLAQKIAELNVQNNKLEDEIVQERKIDKMRRDFISNVSHELKTPIFLIQGYADGLKSNILKDAGKKDFYCDVVIEEAEKMNKIIKDLLSIVKNEKDQRMTKTDSFDLNKLLDRIISKYQMPFLEKKVCFTKEYSSHFLVLGDSFKIEQVVTNYLNNALDHLDQRKIICLKVIREHQKIRVMVYNSGAPIDPQRQCFIWTDFYKVDQARNRAIGGAGLGLAIVKSIMEQHGNGYGVENAPAGVWFWFELDEA